ncbi:MAG: hypothetical protein QM811_12460 [Pirellulales bacterium]
MTFLVAGTNHLFAQTSAESWSSVATANFRVWATDGKTARLVADECERQRRELRDYWQGRPLNATTAPATATWSPERWSSPCDVVVHPTALAFQKAVGPGSERSFGSSYWRVVGGKVTARRIDLRADERDPRTAALPHELTHMILADRMGAKPMPRWLDEGIAVQADVREKRLGHQRDWERSLANRRVFRFQELTTFENYPVAEQIPLFYGQSAALVRELLERGTPAQLLEFAELTRDFGCETAARRVYAIADAKSWETDWLAAERRRVEATLSTNNSHDERLVMAK